MVQISTTFLVAALVIVPALAIPTPQHEATDLEAREPRTRGRSALRTLGRVGSGVNTAVNIGTAVAPLISGREITDNEDFELVSRALAELSDRDLEELETREPAIGGFLRGAKRIFKKFRKGGSVVSTAAQLTPQGRSFDELDVRSIEDLEFDLRDFEDFEEIARGLDELSERDIEEFETREPGLIRGTFHGIKNMFKSLRDKFRGKKAAAEVPAEAPVERDVEESDLESREPRRQGGRRGGRQGGHGGRRGGRRGGHKGGAAAAAAPAAEEAPPAQRDFDEESGLETRRFGGSMGRRVSIRRRPAFGGRKASAPTAEARDFSDDLEARGLQRGGRRGGRHSGRRGGRKGGRRGGRKGGAAAPAPEAEAAPAERDFEDVVYEAREIDELD